MPDTAAVCHVAQGNTQSWPYRRDGHGAAVGLPAGGAVEGREPTRPSHVGVGVPRSHVDAGAGGEPAVLVPRRYAESSHTGTTMPARN